MIRRLLLVLTLSACGPSVHVDVTVRGSGSYDVETIPPSDSPFSAPVTVIIDCREGGGTCHASVGKGAEVSAGAQPSPGFHVAPAQSDCPVGSLSLEKDLTCSVRFVADTPGAGSDGGGVADAGPPSG